MRVTGILPDKFRLAKGSWLLTRNDGKEEKIESDGTRWIDMREYRMTMALNGLTQRMSQEQ